ncbi:acyltransferase [Belnapia rosea]|uniref:acyltransferase n=1 Tax=Belnapia rosea TaxID=938405 RepID=UPI00088A8F70|nr:hypothetical protein [Belnapia rosea]SDB74755.1 Acetyltransferase (isoleucine patch superfamily) [Belnapia rosea]
MPQAAQFLARLREAAPNLLRKISENRTEPRWRYISAQVILLQVRGHIQPVHEYAILNDLDKSALDRRNSDANIFAAGSYDLEKMTLLGNTKADVFIGENAKLKNILIEGTSGRGTIVFGPNVDVSNLVLQISGNGSLVISSGTTMPIPNILIQEEDNYVVIGDDCMFSNNVAIRTSDSHGIYDCKTRQRINQGRPVVIHNHVWVGRHVNINKGTEIGANSVVGQNAVTSGFLRGGAIHAGHPAKPIKEDIWWDRTMSASMDEAMVVHPSRSHMWLHINGCKRIDSYVSQPLSGSHITEVISRVLCAGTSEKILEEYLNQVRPLDEDRKIIREALSIWSDSRSEVL